MLIIRQGLEASPNSSAKFMATHVEQGPTAVCRLQEKKAGWTCDRAQIETQRAAAKPATVEFKTAI